MPRTLTFNKIWHHFRTIQIHRKWVRKYCFYAGIPWRGIKHDLSKYHPTEFFESARYWSGTKSPILAAKADNDGHSMAWIHHKGHNSHHYEYWTDNYDQGCNSMVMPMNDFTEMVCDMIGANIAYNNGKQDNKVFQRCRRYWMDHKKRGCAMHPDNQIMMDIIWNDLAIAELRCKKDKVMPTPIQLIKSGYIQHIWKRNRRQYD